MKTVVIALKGNINYDARVQKFIRTLIDFGFEIKLIVWNWEPIIFNHPRLDIIEANMSNYKIPRNPLITFLLNIKFCYLISVKIKKIRPQFCHFNDLDTFISTLFLRKNSKIKFIYDAHELFPEAQTEPIKRTIWNILERIIIKKADAIIVPEINRAKYLCRKYSLKKEPSVINNFPNYTEVDSQIAKKQRRKLKLLNRKIIIYQGIIGPARFIEKMLEALIFLPDEYVFLLIGISFKNYQQKIKKHAKQAGIAHRVIFYSNVEPKNMLQILAIGDVGLAFYGNATLNDYYCAPNKVFDYIMAGIPVVTNMTPSLNMLNGFASVALIEQIEPKFISEGIKRAVNKKETVSEENKRKFSWENLERKIKGVYS